MILAPFFLFFTFEQSSSGWKEHLILYVDTFCMRIMLSKKCASKDRRDPEWFLSSIAYVIRKSLSFFRNKKNWFRASFLFEVSFFTDTVRLWDITRKEPLKTLAVHLGEFINCIAVQTAHPSITKAYGRPRPGRRTTHPATAGSFSTVPKTPAVSGSCPCSPTPDPSLTFPRSPACPAALSCPSVLCLRHGHGPCVLLWLATRGPTADHVAGEPGKSVEHGRLWRRSDCGHGRRLLLPPKSRSKRGE